MQLFIKQLAVCIFLLTSNFAFAGIIPAPSNNSPFLPTIGFTPPPPSPSINGCEFTQLKCLHHKNGEQYFKVMCLHSLSKKDLACYNKRAQNLVSNPKNLARAIQLIRDNPGKKIIHGNF